MTWAGWLRLVEEGIDRPALYRKLAEQCQWTPRQCQELTPVQMLLVWGPESAGVEMNAEQQLEILNRMRAKRGLPPVENRRKRKGQ